jgi:hypothetical protein
LGEACVNEFEWFLIQKQTGLPEEISGILGLSRPGYSGFKAGPLFIPTLTKNSVLEKNLFSFYMASNKSNVSSFVDFGGIVQEHMGPGMEISWVPLVPHLYWTSKDLYGIRFD